MTTEQLQSEIDRLVEAGDEAAIGEFLVEHFEELPKDAQGALLLSYFTDAVNAKAADAKITELQENALSAFETLSEDEKPQG